MDKSLSIKATLFVALFAGIILPMFLLGGYSISSSRDKLYVDFKRDREEITSNIAKAMRDPLYFFSPNNGSLVLEVIKQDTRISRIEVYDALAETYFITVDLPGRKRSDSYINRVEITRKGEALGWVELEFNDHQIQKSLTENRGILWRVSAFTFLVSISILAPLLYLKILFPLKKLLRQSQEFEDNTFELTYTWDRTDEIGILGQSFEKARLSIVDLVSKLRDKNKELEKLHVTDPLTTLYNRYKLDQTLRDEIQRGDRYPSYQFALILLDLDHFKDVNDTHGHQVGDNVLCGVASLLKEDMRASDIAGRWGGEEFLLIIPYTEKKGAMQLAEKIRAKIASHTFDGVGAMTASFGVSLYFQKEGVEACISRVDKALYKAKETGRNRVVYF